MFFFGIFWNGSPQVDLQSQKAILRVLIHKKCPYFGLHPFPGCQSVTRNFRIHNGDLELNPHLPLGRGPGPTLYLYPAKPTKGLKTFMFHGLLGSKSIPILPTKCRSVSECSTPTGRWCKCSGWRVQIAGVLRPGESVSIIAAAIVACLTVGYSSCSSFIWKWGWCGKVVKYPDISIVAG